MLLENELGEEFHYFILNNGYYASGFVIKKNLGVSCIERKGIHGQWVSLID